ncbi:hypothetical protein [Arthrobacter antibioticus]|uniref:hypothetical protein n=1 Tax=Arthrobacter sp. H35-MC1 TaxID=3046203 RepID=UPI0024BBA405|nr:hypothetical protein [Arthrobacter sp. H35-MC1]MDJ0317307.1 hypothetical protein [Arthrobacter sp. H35-MC1]
MPKDKKPHFFAQRGWISHDANTSRPSPTQEGQEAQDTPQADAPEALNSSPARRKPNMGLGVGLAMGAWFLGTVPILALSAYIQLVDQCTSSPADLCTSASERNNIPVAILIIACMVLGPLFLGIAAATKESWAWLVTVVLALPVIFGGLFVISSMLG